VIIDPAAQEVLKANTALHNASEILFQRAKIKTDMPAGLSTWLAKYGIELCEVSLANIEFDTSYQRAIETKQIEKQKAEQKRYELVQAQRQAEIAAAKAKGKGEALRIKGEAEATYNAQVAASLTSVLIQQQYLSRWDGKLPVYMLAEHKGVLLRLPVGDAGVKRLRWRTSITNIRRQCNALRTLSSTALYLGGDPPRPGWLRARRGPRQSCQAVSVHSARSHQ